MIRAIIVDDEQGPREFLKGAINEYCPHVEIVGIAKDTFEAEKMIEEISPDLLFLDVEMPRRSGIEMLQELSQVDFEVIFTTAFDKYAIQAIKLSALDYLIKPISINDLKEAVEKIMLEKKQSDRLKNLISNTLEDKKKIAIPGFDGISFVPIEDILYCKADGSYTVFKLIDGEEVLASKSLKNYEEILENNTFYRCHKSYLVNLYKINKIDKDGYLFLADKSSIPISRRKKEEIIALISSSNKGF